MEQQTYDLILRNAFLLDGLGGEPIINGLVAVRNGVIAAVFPDGRVSDAITADRVLDLNGAALLPGLIHAHAHTGFKYLKGEPCRGFQEEYLEACLREGITTIRDEGMLIDSSVEEVVEARDRLTGIGKYPRIITTGKFFSAPGGYGGQEPIGITTPEEAHTQVNRTLDLGIDMIKTVLEDGYDPGTMGLPKLSDELLQAICSAAHRRGARVSAHVTASRHLRRLVDAGIDDAGHIPFDEIPQELIEDMVEKGVSIVPTLTVARYFQDRFGAPLLEQGMANVRRFVEAGGKVALGDDFMEEDQPWYRIGLPYMEIELLQRAGLSPMQILVAATKHGAEVCGIADEAGTIEVGKKADLLVVEGNPLQTLEALKHVLYVVKDGHLVVHRRME